MPLSSKFLIRGLLLVVVLATSAVALAQSPRALTESGATAGVRESGLNVYKGVPFAAPPCCTLDWHAQDGCVCPGMYANWCVHARRDAAGSE
jgi:hypothetical protein